MTKCHRKKWVDALSLVLPVLLFFAVLNCFTTYLYYQDYQCKMDILTEVAAGAETTGMDVAAGWLKGNDHQANEQGKQLLEQYGYWENKGTSFYVRFRQNIMITGCTSAVLCLSLLASVDKGTHGFSRGKTTSGVVILVGGRQPACLVCLASRRLSSVKNSEGLAGWSGALSARQRTQTYWRMSRTITRQTAAQSGPQACVPLSTDANVPVLPEES